MGTNNNDLPTIIRSDVVLSSYKVKVKHYLMNKALANILQNKHLVYLMLMAHFNGNQSIDLSYKSVGWFLIEWVVGVE